MQLPPLLPYHIPETMLNEMVKCQVQKEAESMGFVVASNTSTIDNALIQGSQYFNSRPDLTIYHSGKSVAYVIQGTQTDEETGEEMDEEPHKVTITAGGVTEQKLKVKDDLGQLLRGMDKVAGHAAYMHLRRRLPIAEKVFDIIQVFGLLCYYGTRKCKAYKLMIDFLKKRSTLFYGAEDVCLATGISRLFATLKSAK